MKHLKTFFLIVLWALSSTAVAGCIKGAKPTTPSDRFVVNGNEIHDLRTQLTWSRCSSGMTWQGNKCRGAAKLMTLMEAERYAKRSGGGWRLPSIDELLGLVEQRCSNPAINAEIFPDVSELYEGQAKYWSSTSFKEIPSLFHNVDFMDGTVDANSRGMAMGVRLVRHRQK